MFYNYLCSIITCVLILQHVVGVIADAIMPTHDAMQKPGRQAEVNVVSFETTGKRRIMTCNIIITRNNNIVTNICKQLYTVFTEYFDYLSSSSLKEVLIGLWRICSTRLSW